MRIMRRRRDLKTIPDSDLARRGKSGVEGMKAIIVLLIFFKKAFYLFHKRARIASGTNRRSE